MAKTQISDIVEPAIWADYISQRTPTLSRLFNSPLVTTNPRFNEIASNEGGSTVNMPYWKDLSGNSEILSDSSSLTPDKITAGQDKAVVHFRGKAWSANDLAEEFAGDDPMAEIGDKTIEYWDRQMQSRVLIPSLTGIFSSALSGTHVKDIASEDFNNESTPANFLISPDVIIDAQHLLGDHWDSFDAISMHNVVFKRLRKLDLIEYEPLSEQGEVEVPTYLGMRVFVDDGHPTEAGNTSGTKYTSYLFGQGAVGMGMGFLDPDIEVETDRDTLAGDDILVNRKKFILHPRGVAFTGTPAGAGPTKSELETGGNWTKKYDDKNIPIVKLVTNG